MKHFNLTSQFVHLVDPQSNWSPLYYGCAHLIINALTHLELWLQPHQSFVDLYLFFLLHLKWAPRVCLCARVSVNICRRRLHRADQSHRGRRHEGSVRLCCQAFLPKGRAEDPTLPTTMWRHWNQVGCLFPEVVGICHRTRRPNSRPVNLQAWCIVACHKWCTSWTAAIKALY